MTEIQKKEIERYEIVMMHLKHDGWNKASNRMALILEEIYDKNYENARDIAMENQMFYLSSRIEQIFLTNHKPWWKKLYEKVFKKTHNE